jgi:hypothetical protein
MAKKKEQGPRISACGTHKHMINERLTEAVINEGKIVCKDSKGFYVTTAREIDSGLMDPNRQKCTRVRDNELAAEGIVIGTTHNAD